MKEIWKNTSILDSLSAEVLSANHAIRLCGFSGASGTSLLAELAFSVQRPFLIVVKNGAIASQWARDLKFFLSEAGREILTDDRDGVEPGMRSETSGRVILFPELNTSSEDLKDTNVIFNAHLNASLKSLKEQKCPVAVVPASFLGVRVNTPEEFDKSTITLHSGVQARIKDLLENLIQIGYKRVTRVESPGEFALRGGILDLYIPVYSFPVRIEYFGDEVISIREFDSLTQRSISRVKTIRISKVIDQLSETGNAPFFQSLQDWFGLNMTAFWVEPDVILEELKRTAPLDFQQISRRSLPGNPPVFWDLIEDVLSTDDQVLTLPSVPVPEFNGDYRKMSLEFQKWADEGYRIVVIYHRESVRRVITERLASMDMQKDSDDRPWYRQEPGKTRRGSVSTMFIPGVLSHGFRIPDVKTVFVTERDIIGKKQNQVWKRTDDLEKGLSFQDLRPGDLVVHVDHGIGRYDGLHRLTVNGKERDFLLLRYAEDQKLYIPVDKLYQIQRYISSSEAKPSLDKMGGVTWKSRKRKVKESVLRLAAELLKLFSQREVLTGFAFPPDDGWQREFELGFDYEETPDQYKAINDVKSDMESPKPMDRVVCGDVGYGKTEVAMRAAFKAAVAGRQVAVLVPTTILAQQHFRSFQKRFANFPLKMAMLSRFLNARDKKVVLEHLSNGTIDVVIGTHALLGDQVRFKNLGLLIIDEEHRFGVKHKERLKQLRASIDVLTLTATPIPRTLNMSLLGLREISLINTPPEARLPINTRIVKFNPQLIRQAIMDEIDRGGQVYFVHNRVHSIYAMADMLKKLIPEVRIGVGHGQMNESALEKIMLRFLEKDFDVLVCTTIIESGLDISSVNTIIINRADQLGLAQLYQLRGRVGRDRYQAYAWLLVPASRIVTPKATERLAAIRDSVELGSGFGLATRDLDIRGAGDILGPNQHGHISAVGFEMYCHLIREAVQELKGERRESLNECDIRLPYDLAIPSEYVEDPTARVEIYRRFSTVTSTDQISTMINNLSDQYGDVPEAVQVLANVAGIRIVATKLAISTLDYKNNSVIATFHESTPLKPERLMSLLLNQPQKFQFAPPEKLIIQVSGGPGNQLVGKTRHALEQVLDLC